jgi:hypothetical protein
VHSIAKGCHHSHKIISLSKNGFFPSIEGVRIYVSHLPKRNEQWYLYYFIFNDLISQSSFKEFHWRIFIPHLTNIPLFNRDHYPACINPLSPVIVVLGLWISELKWPKKKENSLGIGPIGGNPSRDMAIPRVNYYWWGWHRRPTAAIELPAFLLATSPRISW